MATIAAIPIGVEHRHIDGHYARFYDGPPPPQQMVADYWYDATVGTAILNAPEDVRLGVACGNTGQVGTLAAGGGGEFWG